jgi:hypothetical protein
VGQQKLWRYWCEGKAPIGSIARRKVWRRHSVFNSSARGTCKSVFWTICTAPLCHLPGSEGAGISQRSKIQVRHCEKSIWPSDYWIKVDNGKHWTYFPSGKYFDSILYHFLIWGWNIVTGFYHIECFEELLDLSSSAYASRFEPDMKYFPGRMEICILQEYVRWMIRVGVQVCTSCCES